MADLVCMLLTNDAVSDPRVEKEAMALSASGRRVVVIAWNRSGDEPQHEQRKGFEIVRVGPRAGHGKGLLNVRHYPGYWSDAAHETVSLGADVIHCHDADTIPAGLKAKRLLASEGKKVHLVVDFHELYRDSKMVPQKGIVGVAARAAVQRVERAGVRSADLVIVANPGTAEYYGDLRGPGGKGEATPVLVAENAPDMELMDAVERRPHDLFTVCFIGQKRYFQTLQVLMDAVGGMEGVRGMLLGGGVDESRVAEYAHRYPNLITEGRLLYSDIPSRYAECDAVYAVNDPGVGNMRVNFPVKAMEGMAFGLPVLVSTGTWIGDYVEAQGIGIAVQPDVPSVMNAIVRLRDNPDVARDMGRRGRDIVERELNWRTVAQRVAAAYDRLG